MSELCLHLRAATYVTSSCLTTQNLALVWSAFWVSLILSGLTMSGWSLLFFLAEKSAYSAPYSNRAKDSPRIHNHFFQGFMDVSNILKLKHWSAFIPNQPDWILNGLGKFWSPPPFPLTPPKICKGGRIERKVIFFSVLMKRDEDKCLLALSGSVGAKKEKVWVRRRKQRERRWQPSLPQGYVKIFHWWHLVEAFVLKAVFHYIPCLESKEMLSMWVDEWRVHGVDILPPRCLASLIEKKVKRIPVCILFVSQECNEHYLSRPLCCSCVWLPL